MPLPDLFPNCCIETKGDLTITKSGNLESRNWSVLTPFMPPQLTCLRGEADRSGYKALRLEVYQMKHDIEEFNKGLIEELKKRLIDPS